MFYVDLKFHLQLFIKYVNFFKEHFKIQLIEKLWLYDYMEEDTVIVSKHLIKRS